MSVVKRICNFIVWSRPRERARHDYYNVFKGTLRDIGAVLSDVMGKRVLDIGCGAFFPQTLLFNSIGARVTGIDISYVVPSLNPFRRCCLFREAHPTEVLHHVAIELFQSPLYYKELKRVAEFPMRIENLDIRQMDACNMSFDDETFDLVISNATFEHIMGLDKAVQEIYRVMKDGSIARVSIHLFPSLTGGHTAVYAPPGSDIVILEGEPWDHLRKKFCPRVKLNRLKEKDYRRIFGSKFNILKWYTAFYEPKFFLTPNIQAGLANWSEDELLKREIVVVLGK